MLIFKINLYAIDSYTFTFLFFEDGENPSDENNAPSNDHENFEHTGQRGGVDNAGYSIPFVGNQDYTIPNIGGRNVPAREADEIRGVNGTWPQSSSSAAENLAHRYENDSDEENSTDDETLDDIVENIEAIQTGETSQAETSNEFALPDSSRIKEISLDQFPPDSDEPPIGISSEESETSPQGSSEDRYKNGALQNDSGSDDIVLVYVLPNSDQKPKEERQSEAGEASKISVDNSPLPPSDGALEDDNSTDDVALVYIEPISDEPQPATCSPSNIATADHGRNAKNDATADGVSQANGGRHGHDIANGGQNVPGYQPLDQQKREAEEKSRYQKLIKRKVA